MADAIEMAALTAEAFAAYGEVIEARGDPTMLINGGRCGRFHDLARLDFHESGSAGINIFQSQPISIPLELAMVERHPLGSQAFMPMSGCDYVVVVADDDGGRPVRPRAFRARSDQGVNYHRGTWHGVLMPIDEAALFAVVDWIGDRKNVEEFHFEQPFIITSGTNRSAVNEAELES